MTEEEDALTSLAFSMHSTPGAYAVLLGAGVSAAGGIPTAWGVLTDLVGRLAAVPTSASDTGDKAVENEVEPEARLRWYEQTFGEPARYEQILERLAPTKLERQRLLRGYFEPGSDDPSGEPIVPTSAHRSLARLVRLGAVKVVVTLNFDKLAEQAIRDEGVEPTVISTPGDAARAAPLHTMRCCVLHLHGDYLNPASMLNTFTELVRYKPPTRRLISQILRDHGLLIAGWSASYDPALRQLITSNFRPNFSTAWIDPQEPSIEAKEVAGVIRSTPVRQDADISFGWLSDAVESMNTRRGRHPLTVPVAVQTAKRAIAGGRVALDLHDTIGRELARLNAHPHLNLAHRGDDESWGGISAMSEQVAESTAVPAALAATTAYWSDLRTNSWWADHLPRLCERIDGYGDLDVLDLPQVPASMLYYAGGVAAVAAGRVDLIISLLHLRHRAPDGLSRPRVAGALAAEHAFRTLGGSAGLYRWLLPVLGEVITSGEHPIEHAWQRFEILLSIVSTLDHPRFAALAQASIVARRELAETSRAFDSAEGQKADLDEVRRARATASQADGAALGAVANLCPLRSPHVLTARVRGDGRYWVSPVADDVAREVDQRGGLGWDLVEAGLADRDDVAVAARAVSVSLGRRGRELSDGSLYRDGQSPSKVWVDRRVAHAG